MTGWLRRLVALALVALLSVSQTLVPSVAVAQQFVPFQGELQIRPILEGEPVESEITSSDVNLDGLYFDTFAFAGYADDLVTIAIGPSRLNGILLVGDEEGEVLGELVFEPNSAVRSLRVELPSDGPYLVVIGSAGRGSYSVTLSSRGDSGDVDPTERVENRNVQSLRFGEWYEGVLEESDTETGDADGAVVDLYVVEGRPGQRYRVTVESDAFTPVLVASDGTEAEPSVNIGTNGRLVVRARFSGEGPLVLGVTSLHAELGDYRIMIELEGSR